MGEVTIYQFFTHHYIDGDDKENLIVHFKRASDGAWVDVRPLFCPECATLFTQSTVENRGDVLWRVTCPNGHTWDVYPHDLEVVASHD